MRQEKKRTRRFVRGSNFTEVSTDLEKVVRGMKVMHTRIFQSNDRMPYRVIHHKHMGSIFKSLQQRHILPRMRPSFCLHTTA